MDYNDKKRKGCGSVEAKQRVAWADMAKGYGILAIMVSHVWTGHTLSLWLFTFHVPLFFFLSGFLFRGGKPFGVFLKGKLRRMVVPYFALALPIVAAEAAMSGKRADFWQRFASLAGQVVLQRRLWPIWFLACLFLLELIAWGLTKVLRKDGLLALAGAAMGILGVAYARLGGPVLPWNLDACFPVMPFFIAGFLLNRHNGWFEKNIVGVRSVLLFVLLALGNLAFGWKAIRGEVPVLNVFANEYGVPALSYAAAFCGIGAVVLASRWGSLAPVRYLGRNSLLYFVWHQTPVITAIYYYFPKIGIPMENYPSTAVMLAEKALEMGIILVLLTLCNELLSRSRLRWVLGR